MSYERQPLVAKCSCEHHDSLHEDVGNPVLSENHEGPCTRCDDCFAYDGLPPIHPRWIFEYRQGEAETLESVLSKPDRPLVAPKLESYYRDLLAAQVGGQTEFLLEFGRADVITKTTVFEVEPVKSWRVGVAQALRYAAQLTQQGAVALYGKGVPQETVLAKLSSLPAPGLELWWFEGGRFVCIKGARDGEVDSPGA